MKACDETSTRQPLRITVRSRMSRWLLPRCAMTFGVMTFGIGHASAQAPLGTAFTYQGQLKHAGVSLTGTLDLQGSLWDAAIGGEAVGTPLTVSNVQATNGLFTAELDFGPAAFSGDARWLEIAIRHPSGAGGFTTLAPRQKFSAAPYALFATETGSAWNLAGNAGTDPVTAFVGTLDNQALEFRVNGSRALRIEPNQDGPNIVGGAADNQVTPQAYAVTIGGGIGNNSSGYRSTIGGGQGHHSAGSYSTVPGGAENLAGGEYSFAAGRRAKARSPAQSGDANGDEGTFVWADSTDLDFTSSGPNQFNVRANGGLYFDTGNLGTGIRMNPSAQPLITRGYDAFTGGTHGGAGRWGLFMEPYTLALGMPAISDAPERTVRIVKYNADSTYTTLAAFQQDGCLTAGRRAKVRLEDEGTFVWADSEDADFESTGSNQFLIRASGGVAVNSQPQSTSTFLVSRSNGGSSIYGEATNGGTGVRGSSDSGNGVYGHSVTGLGVGVRGYCTSGIGVRGSSDSGWGVHGWADSGRGVFGYAASGHAGYFEGKVHVNGTLSKSSGAFKIDHPLAPESKYLQHSFVESPDMMNVYNGNVVTDDSGEAVVELPAYFEALNRDFRYQLTVIGQFAQAIVAEKIKGARFTINTDKPRVEVSWQVTGIRKDPYAQAHPIEVEPGKPAEEVGSYLHPELYGQPKDKSVEAVRTALMAQSATGKQFQANQKHQTAGQ